MSLTRTCVGIRRCGGSSAPTPRVSSNNKFMILAASSATAGRSASRARAIRLSMPSMSARHVVHHSTGYSCGKLAPGELSCRPIMSSAFASASGVGVTAVYRGTNTSNAPSGNLDSTDYKSEDEPSRPPPCAAARAATTDSNAAAYSASRTRQLGAHLHMSPLTQSGHC